MDLSTGCPRSPAATLGGIVWLPRLIDKTRAELAGKLGSYIYNCPLDTRLFDFMGVSPEEFRDGVKQSPDDNAILAWINKHSGERREAAIQEFNRMLSSMGPTKPDAQQRFAATLEKLAPGRKDISTWFGLLDLEEGR